MCYLWSLVLLLLFCLFIVADMKKILHAFRLLPVLVLPSFSSGKSLTRVQKWWVNCVIKIICMYNVSPERASISGNRCRTHWYLTCVACVCARARTCAHVWHFCKSIGPIVWAVTCVLHYCSLSWRVSASYSNPKEGKRQKKKEKTQPLFKFSLWNTPSFCWWTPTFVWSDEIDCVNSECSAKVLMEVEKGKNSSDRVR